MAGIPRDKRTHFREEAQKRAVMILDHLDRLGKLSNRNSNQWTTQEIDQLFGTIEAKIGEVVARFGEPKIMSAFTFDEPAPPRPSV